MLLFCGRRNIWWNCSDFGLLPFLADTIFGEVAMPIFVAGTIFGEIAVILDCYFLSQTQYLMKLQCQFSLQAQYLVKLQWFWIVTFCGRRNSWWSCNANFRGRQQYLVKLQWFWIVTFCGRRNSWWSCNVNFCGRQQYLVKLQRFWIGTFRGRHNIWWNCNDFGLLPCGRCTIFVFDLNLASESLKAYPLKPLFGWIPEVPVPLNTPSPFPPVKTLKVCLIRSSACTDDPCEWCVRRWPSKCVRGWPLALS